MKIKTEYVFCGAVLVINWLILVGLLFTVLTEAKRECPPMFRTSRP